jgi:hypothetical protein
MIVFKKQEAFASRAKRAIKTLNVGALLTIAHDIAKDYFAGYNLVCNYGTNKLFWTMKGAESWLHACGDRAYILETYDFQIIASRIQSN